MNSPDDNPASSPTMGDAVCRTCGYSLRGLTEPRCPECGTAFDWTDVVTYGAAALTSWDKSLPSPGPIAFLATVGSLCRHPVAFVRRLSTRKHRPFPFRTRLLLCVSGFLLALIAQVDATWMLAWNPFHDPWLERLRAARLWFFSANHYFHGAERWLLLTAALLCSSLFVSGMLRALGARRCALLSGLSGICTLCILLLPGFVIREEQLALWAMALPQSQSPRDYLAFRLLWDWALPVWIWSGIVVAGLGRTVGNLTQRRAATAGLLGAGLAYLAFHLIRFAVYQIPGLAYWLS